MVPTPQIANAIKEELTRSLLPKIYGDDEKYDMKFFMAILDRTVSIDGNQMQIRIFRRFPISKNLMTFDEIHQYIKDSDGTNSQTVEDCKALVEMEESINKSLESICGLHLIRLQRVSFALYDRIQKKEIISDFDIILDNVSNLPYILLQYHIE